MLHDTTYCNCDEDVLFGLASNHSAAIWIDRHECLLDSEPIVAALQTKHAAVGKADSKQ